MNKTTMESSKQIPQQVASSPLKKLLFSMAALLIIALFSECFFACLVHQKSQQTLGGFVEQDTELLWKLKPMKQPPLQTNSLGFRDGPYKAKADVKILLLGDSVSWGDGIWKTKQVYPQILEQKLANALKPKAVEVINTGVPGYSTLQQLKYLRSKGMALKPDLIVLQFCFNDITEAPIAMKAYKRPKSRSSGTFQKTLRTLYNRLLQHSYTFAAIIKWRQKNLRQKRAQQIEHLAKNPKDRRFVEGWRTTFEALRKMQLLAHKHSVPIMLFIPPYRFQLKNADYPKLQKQLHAFLKRQQLDYVDTLSALSKLQKKHSQSLYRDANHFSILGHRKVAELLLKPIQKKLQQQKKRKRISK